MGHTSTLRKFLAPEFIFGVGALQLAGQYGRNLGGTKALIVSDPGVVAAGCVDRVTATIEAADLAYALFTKVTPNPRMDEIAEGAAMYARERCDIIIAVGGGSSIDSAKCIGLLAANQGELWDFVGVDKVSAPTAPTICIPTTAGTSADVAQFAMVLDAAKKRKVAIISKALVPDISLIDPTTLTTMDPFLTACTGLDALTHAIEAYVSLGASPITDLHALEALRLISGNLERSLAEPNNVDYRTNMMLGSLEAGLAFSNASLGVMHAMSHSVGGVLDLPHGQCNATILESVINFNYEQAAPRFRDIAAAMGLETGGLTSADIRKRLLSEIRRVKEVAKLSDTLSRLGVHRTETHELAEFALSDPCCVTNPRKAGKRDFEVIYEESL
jgi:alcohol dehydrogenase